VRSARTILVAGAILLACCPPAVAQSERAGVYGGGAIRDYLHFVSVHVREDGSFDADATLVTKCSPRFGDALTATVMIRDETLSPLGRYSATNSFTDDIAPGVPVVGGLRAEGTIAFSVEVEGGASGFVQVRTTYRDPDTNKVVSRCDTGRIEWAARRPPRDAGLGKPAPGLGAGPWPRAGRVLRGVTAQDEPFLMRVTRRGRLVHRAGLTVQVGCASDVGLGLDVVAHRVRVRRGRFGARDRFRREFVRPNGRRLVETYSWVLRGRFGRRGARGTFRIRGVVRRRGDGREIGSCTTNEFVWRAVP
jgi:hypothetical protein